jgi:hypothetical protein
MTRSAARPWLLALTGLLGGFFSGLFGVGGGIVLVPLLVLLLRFDHRHASGTSLAAIVPAAIAGTVSYAARGSIDWVAGGCLAAGAVLGSLIGTWLLHRTHHEVLRWIFIVFLLVTAVRLAFSVPPRSVQFALEPGTVVGLVALGLVAGILSGLLGIGGGVIVVPALVLLFGVGDLVAKGTSLLMMIPTSIVGTVSNARRGNVDVRAAAVIGSLAVVASVGGAALAAVLPPLLGNILFALLLVYSASQLAWNAVRSRRKAPDADPE